MRTSVGSWMPFSDLSPTPDRTLCHRLMLGLCDSRCRQAIAQVSPLAGSSKLEEPIKARLEDWGVYAVLA